MSFVIKFNPARFSIASCDAKHSPADILKIHLLKHTSCLPFPLRFHWLVQQGTWEGTISHCWCRSSLVRVLTPCRGLHGPHAQTQGAADPARGRCPIQPPQGRCGCNQCHDCSASPKQSAPMGQASSFHPPQKQVCYSALSSVSCAFICSCSFWVNLGSTTLSYCQPVAIQNCGTCLPVEVCVCFN